MIQSLKCAVYPISKKMRFKTDGVAVDIYVLTFCVALFGFWLLWPLSILRHDVSIVDFWWAPGFTVMGWVGWYLSGQPLSGISALALALITAWGLRLGFTLSTRRIREGVEDPRYQEMRAIRGPGFWWKSFFIIFSLQAFVQCLIASGLIATIIAGGEIGLLAMIGAFIAVMGASIEARSDWELDRFRKTTPHGGMLTTGLRAIVRYPSYSGEILFWIGLSLIGLDAGVLWAPLKALLVTVMLIRLSGVALLDDRFQRTREGFSGYAKAVPALIPRLGFR